MSLRLGIGRFGVYTVLVAFVAYAVYWAAINDPDGLRLAVNPAADPSQVTSEFSLLEGLHNAALIVCAAIFGWVAARDRLRRPLGIACASVFLVGLVRECDFQLDLYAADNVWQVIAALIIAVSGVYLARHRRRLVSGWQRSWPSAGLAIVIAGCLILVPVAQALGQKELWQATLGESYSVAAVIAFEELAELGGYLLLLVGSIEFLYTWSRLPKTRELDRPRRYRRRKRAQ